MGAIKAFYASGGGPGQAARGRRPVLVGARAVRLLGLGRSRRVVPTRLPLLRARRPPPRAAWAPPRPLWYAALAPGSLRPSLPPFGRPPSAFLRTSRPPAPVASRPWLVRSGARRPPGALAPSPPAPSLGLVRRCGRAFSRLRRGAPLRLRRRSLPPLRPSGRPSAAFGLPSVALVRSVAPVGSSRRPPGPPRARPRRFAARLRGPGLRAAGRGAASPPLFPPAPRRAFLCSRPPAVAALRLSGLCVLPGALSRRLLPLPPFRPPVPRWGRGGDARPRHRCGGDEGRPLRECPSTPAAGIIPPVSRAARVAFGHP